MADFLEILYSKQAKKFLQKQDNNINSRIKTAVEKLPNGDVVRLKGTDDAYRLRIGDFRIIFFKEADIIKVSKIDNRGQVYKD